MTESLHEIIRTGDEGRKDAAFPHAPPGWTREVALVTAEAEGVVMKDDHWKSVRALQEFYARHEGATINARDIHDALGEKFHAQGGMRYLYVLFPGGPVAQGCRIAGLKAPAGATDRGFGSVV
jgi:tRNA 2-thiouridine synthesizing protein E